MIETHRLKNVVIFVQTILSFVLSRKIIDIIFTVSKIQTMRRLSNSTTNWFAGLFLIVVRLSIIQSLFIVIL